MRSDGTQVVLPESRGDVRTPMSEGWRDAVPTPAARRARMLRAKRYALTRLGRARHRPGPRERARDVARRFERELELRELDPLRDGNDDADLRALELSAWTGPPMLIRDASSLEGAPPSRSRTRRGSTGSSAPPRTVSAKTGPSPTRPPTGRGSPPSGRDPEVRDFDPDADLRWRTKETVLAGLRANRVTDDDLERSPALRKMLLEDLETQRRREGPLDPDDVRLEDRWRRYDDSRGSRHDHASVLEEIDSYAPASTREAERPRWRRATLLARRAATTWWPTWVARRTPVVEAEQLVRRFADAVRIVELREKSARTPAESLELADLSRREHRLLREEGSMWTLDTLLGREARPPGPLPPGYLGGTSQRLLSGNAEEKRAGGEEPPTLDRARLARRLVNAARIVELRKLPVRSSEEEQELRSRAAFEQDALRREGTAPALDDLLGRARKGRRDRSDALLTRGDRRPRLGGSSGSGSVPIGALSMRDDSPKVILPSSTSTSGPTPPTTSGGSDADPRRTGSSSEGKRIDDLTRRTPPPLPRPEVFAGLSESDFVRGGLEPSPGPLPRRTDTTVPGPAVRLDQLGDRDLARLLARILEEPGVGQRLVERALASLETKRRRERLREVR